eukprot:g31503.t1
MKRNPKKAWSILTRVGLVKEGEVSTKSFFFTKLSLITKEYSFRPVGGAGNVGWGSWRPRPGVQGTLVGGVGGQGQGYRERWLGELAAKARGKGGLVRHVSWLRKHFPKQVSSHPPSDYHVLVAVEAVVVSERGAFMQLQGLAGKTNFFEKRVSVPVPPLKTPNNYHTILWPFAGKDCEIATARATAVAWVKESKPASALAMSCWSAAIVLGPTCCLLLVALVPAYLSRRHCFPISATQSGVHLIAQAFNTLNFVLALMAALLRETALARRCVHTGLRACLAIPVTFSSLSFGANVSKPAPARRQPAGCANGTNPFCLQQQQSLLECGVRGRVYAMRLYVRDLRWRAPPSRGGLRGVGPKLRELNVTGMAKHARKPAEGVDPVRTPRRLARRSPLLRRCPQQQLGNRETARDLLQQHKVSQVVLIRASAPPAPPGSSSSSEARPLRSLQDVHKLVKESSQQAWTKAVDHARMQAGWLDMDRS